MTSLMMRKINDHTFCESSESNAGDDTREVSWGVHSLHNPAQGGSDRGPSQHFIATVPAQIATLQLT